VCPQVHSAPAAGRWGRGGGNLIAGRTPLRALRATCNESSVAVRGRAPEDTPLHLLSPMATDVVIAFSRPSRLYSEPARRFALSSTELAEPLRGFVEAEDERLPPFKNSAMVFR
jgi:hypothetical protein